ncbi:MAG TPA: hypothetical protein VN883_15415 [Myxococcales bacterium]|jgi:hypothetical protein|nr:hypothetical protein [Myxococcales bacterium]
MADQSGLWTARRALSLVEKTGVALESGRGPVPNLIDAIAGAPVTGQWSDHPQGKLMTELVRSVRQSPDVLVCKLVQNRATLVHRRLWPALVRLAPVKGAKILDRIRDEPQPDGTVKETLLPYPAWVTLQIKEAARAMSEQEARIRLGGVASLLPKTVDDT